MAIGAGGGGGAYLRADGAWWGRAAKFKGFQFNSLGNTYYCSDVARSLLCFKSIVRPYT